MRYFKEIMDERIRMALTGAAICFITQRCFSIIAPYQWHKIEQKKLEKGIYLSNSGSIERCSKVIDYYEDIFGTFEWAH